MLLEEVDLESTSEPASSVGKPVLHMQPMHTGEPVARSADALARPASNNMPLSEHDTQELRRLLYLKAEGIERQERLQYLRQTWKSSIWSEEDDDSYTLPDPEIPLVYSLHYGQQCPPEWDDGSVPTQTADRQKKKEHGKSNLHAEEDFLQKLESLNLDTRLTKLLITYEARCVFPPWGQASPQLGPLTGPDPWGSTLPYRVYHTPMCATYVCVCLTSLPGVAPGDSASLTSERRS